MKYLSQNRILSSIAVIALSLCALSSCLAQTSKPTDKKSAKVPSKESTEEKKLETATFGGGCFWCVEAVYQRVAGVSKVVSGYAGGSVLNPTYEQVCTGRTGHAEVCQITFDPSTVSFEEMLLIFLKSHDPTTLNRQGPDAGTQYRSVIFYHDSAQRIAAEKVIEEVTSEKIYGNNKIVTEISPLPEFFMAEDYHQSYFKLHPNVPYCKAMIVPKLAKFEKLFKEKSKLQREKEAKKIPNKE